MKEKSKAFVSLYGIEADRLPHGSWIALEGTDVVGKTSQLSELVKASRMVLPCTAVTEFSNSPLGNTINKIISRQRFYSLDPQHRTPKADTLALAADLMFNIERDIVPMLRKNGLIFSDRGPASTLAYQSIRLHDWQPEEFATVEKAMEVVYPLIAIMPVRPNKTILLIIDDAERQRRIVQRGEKPFTLDELDFLHKTDKIMEKAARMTSDQVVVLNTSDTPEHITKNILSSICIPTGL